MPLPSDQSRSDTPATLGHGSFEADDGANSVKKAFSYTQSLAGVRDRRGELVRSEFLRSTESLTA